MNLSQIRATYDRLAPTYDKTVGFTERLFLGDLRQAFGAASRHSYNHGVSRSRGRHTPPGAT